MNDTQQAIDRTLKLADFYEARANGGQKTGRAFSFVNEDRQWARWLRLTAELAKKAQ